MTSEPNALPSYDELPVDPGLPPGSSWGLWGDDDVLGCLNLLTAERVRHGAALVKTGETFALNWDMGMPDPPLFGRAKFDHTVTWLGDTAHDDLLTNWNTQSSSQWDGFRHVRSPKHGFYAGVADEDHGMHHWAARGIAGRCVLVDMGRYREGVGRPLRMDEPDPIEPAEVTAALEAQGSVVEIGDVLLVRTGWMSWYKSLDHAGRLQVATRSVAPGLRPGRETARLLWNLHVAAVAADNPALEVMPPGALATPEQRAAARADPDEGLEVFVHLSLLPLLGMPIGEMFDLDALAEACAADGRYDALFTSAPLNLHAGVASPPNALVLR